MSEEKKKAPQKKFTAAQRSKCLKDYLQMPAPRSVEKLAQMYETMKLEGSKRDLPSLSTLKNWAARYSWKRQSKQYDADVQEKMATILSDHGKDVESIMDLLRGNAALCLKRLQDVILTVDVERPLDVKHLTDAAKGFMQVHESLRGSVTEKEETEQAKAPEEYGIEHAREIAESLKNIELTINPQGHMQH